MIEELLIHPKNAKGYETLYTVAPPNKGQVGAWALVHYSGVVLYWGVFVKKPFLCVVSVYSKCTNYYGQSWSSSSSMVTDIDLRLFIQQKRSHNDR